MCVCVCVCTLSPLLSQSLDTFGAALQSGQLGPLMSQFGLQQETAQAATTGSEDAYQTDRQTDNRQISKQAER